VVEIFDAFLDEIHDNFTEEVMVDSFYSECKAAIDACKKEE